MRQYRKVFLSTPEDGKNKRRFKKFKRMIGKFRHSLKKNRRQPNFEIDFLGKPRIYFFECVWYKTQNEDTPAEITADTSLTFRNSGQWEDSVRVTTLSKEFGR